MQTVCNRLDHICTSDFGQSIGVGRFRILGGGGHGLEYWGAMGAQIPRSQTRFLINQCQIIKFLILKSDIIENSRIELKEVVLPISSNQIKVTVVIILPFNLVRL